MKGVWLLQAAAYCSPLRRSLNRLLWDHRHAHMNQGTYNDDKTFDEDHTIFHTHSMWKTVHKVRQGQNLEIYLILMIPGFRLVKIIIVANVALWRMEYMLNFTVSVAEIANTCQNSHSVDRCVHGGVFNLFKTMKVLLPSSAKFSYTKYIFRFSEKVPKMS